MFWRAHAHAVASYLANFLSNLNVGQDTRAGKDQGRIQQTRTTRGATSIGSSVVGRARAAMRRKERSRPPSTTATLVSDI